MYDPSVFDIIKTLESSGRGELEITDVNNAYIERSAMTYEIIEGWWSDAGTFESLVRANILVASQHEVNPEELPRAALQSSAEQKVALSRIKGASAARLAGNLNDLTLATSLR